MQRDDLPLFAWQPPKQVLVFPLVNRIGKVRHTACKLAGKHGDDAALYWKQVTASQRKHLERIGLSADEVEAQLRQFFFAVQGEMTRMGRDHRGHPGGAA